MEISIDIDQYLTEEDKRNIARETFRQACDSKARGEFERILTNASYKIVEQEVNKLMNEDMQELIVSKVKKVINELSTYSVFKNSDTWGGKPSRGYILLEAAVDSNKNMIQDRVHKIIKEELKTDTFREQLSYLISDAIIDKLQSAKE